MLPTVAVLALLTPEYTATAIVSQRSNAPPAERVSDLKATIGSAAFLAQVIERQNLDRNAEFAANPVRFLDSPSGWLATRYARLANAASSIGLDLPRGGEEKTTTVPEALRQRIGVAAASESGLVAISVRSVDRATAAKVADAVASLYVEEAAAAARDAERRTAARLGEQQAALQRETAAASQAVAAFRERSGLANDSKTVALSLADLGTQLATAHAQTLDRQARVAALRRAQSAGDARGGAADIIANPTIGALRVQEVDASRRLLDLSQKYGENHPRVVAARAELGQVQGAIAAETRKIVTALEAELSASEAREKELEQRIANLREQARSVDQKEAELKQLEKTAEEKSDAYRTFLRQLNEPRKEPEAGARIFASAPVPEVPSSPRYVEATSIALAAGLLLGLLGCWGLELLDGGFRTGRQIEQLTGHPSIGMVPALSRAVLRRATPVQYALHKHMSAYAESLRSVRTSIALASGGLDHKVVMITSSLPGEGKSTFSCSLAQVLARSNPAKKIIIVDCDLRRPAVLDLLRKPEPRGTIDEYLAGTKSLTAILHRDESSGLYYIPARFGTKHSMELLGSSKMQTLVNALSAEFDLVLLDTPPLMAVADPRVVAALTDYVVFLVRWGKTDRTFAAEALKLLDGVSRVGVVLSQVDLRRHSRYGYADHGTYYSKYGSYYLDS